MDTIHNRVIDHLSAASEPQEYRAAQGSGGQIYDPDYTSAHQYAESHHASYGGGSASDLFSTAINYLGGREKELGREDIDEYSFVENHRAAYEGGGTTMGSQGMGQAAAMQALKMVMGGKGGAPGGGRDQNKLIGLAMSEAIKLFDNQKSMGNVVSFCLGRV